VRQPTPNSPGRRRDRGTVLADPAADLHARPRGRRRPRRDHVAGLGPGPLWTQRVGAAPDPLDPHQGHRPARCGQVPHPARPTVVQLRDRPALRAPHQVGGRLDRLLELAVVLRHGQHHEPGQAQHRRRSTTLTFHLGPPFRVLNTTNHEAPGPCSRPG
jgi:hypothetical protein